MATIRSLDAARPHVAAKAKCVHCGFEWVAVVPETATKSLECKHCGGFSDAAHHARVSIALEVLDSLREAVASGAVIAFAAVGVEQDDTTRVWSSATADVSKLRLMGAMSHLSHMYAHGELDD